MGRVLPMLFNTEMVLGILEGRKTATRRVIKPQPAQGQNHRLGICTAGDKKDTGKYVFSTEECGGRLLYVRPPCLPGDILYVRETWSFLPCIECRMEGGCSRIPAPYEDKDEASEGCYIYRAGCAAPERIVWRPSIHMPKEAARIWLKVKRTAAERLHDMKLEDFLSEGASVRPEAFNDPDNAYLQAREAFINIWDSTIPKGQQALYCWDADPWVWAVEFERCGRPGE